MFLAEFMTKLLFSLLARGGILTGSAHPVLRKAGIIPNDFDILINYATELDSNKWIDTLCLKYGLTYMSGERALYKDGVKVVDLIFISKKVSVKSETFEGIECVSVYTLLKHYRNIGDDMDRGEKHDAHKIKILQDYLSSYKPVTSQNFEVSVLRDNTLCFDSPLKRLNSFDSPVSKKLNSFDSPVSKKLNSFDSPVSKKLNSFDSPVSKKLNSFDSPVSFDPTSYESPPKKHKSVA
jgi:hypothetical protein